MSITNRAHDGDQLSKNSEFEFETDAINHTLESLLQDPLVFVFVCQKPIIHQKNNDINDR